MTKLKLKSDIFKSSNIFFIYTKCLKIYYLNIIKKIKKDCKKKARKRYQNLSKEEKEKNNNVVVNVTKISQKVKNKSLLSIERNIIE